MDLPGEPFDRALGLLEAAGEVVPLGRRERDCCALAQPLQGAPRHGREHLEVMQELLGGALGLARAGPPVLPPRLENQQRIAEHERARLRAPAAVGRDQLSDLPAREPPASDRAGEALTLAAVGARQGDQVLHCRVRNELSAKHPLLDRLGQVPDQAEAPAHPARAAVEPPGQFVQGEREAQVQLPQPQPLLEGALLRARTHQPSQKKSLGLVQLPAGGPQRVEPEPVHRAGPLVAVHDDVPLGFVRRGHHHDRHLLSVLGQRGHEPPLPLRASRPQVLVAQDQLVVLEVHRVSDRRALLTWEKKKRR